jgi:hypothetical protein
MAKRPRVRAPVLTRAERKRRRYIESARRIYEMNASAYAFKDNDIEIDNDAKLSESEGGCWVQAWVFVYKEDLQ